jgi:two-component system, OmpR family, sensor kinase
MVVFRRRLSTMTAAIMETPADSAFEPSKPSTALTHSSVSTRVSGYAWLLILAAGPLLLLVLRLVPALDQHILHDPLAHVLIAGGASLLGMALALFVLHVARQVFDARVYLIGMGFLSIASIFFIHAISTPDVLMTGRGVATGWSARISLALGGIFFALSALRLSDEFNRFVMRYARTGVLLFVFVWVAYSLAFLFVIPALAAQSASQAQQSTTVDWTNVVRIALWVVGLCCYGLAIVQHYRLYRRSSWVGGLAVVGGIALLGEALLTQQFSQTYAVSFWLYHTQEFVAFGVIGYAGLLAYRRGEPRTGLLEGLFLAPTRVRLQTAYAQAMDSLVDMLSRGEEPSPSQLQEVQRRFGLSETQVSVVERAALAVAHERRQRQELERLNTTLRQLEQDKEQLMQMVVHDLKNPLTALIGFLEILRMDHLTNEQMLLLEGALRSGKNLSGLISDLLDVSQAEEGQLELARVAFVPRELLTDCAAEMSAWLAQDGKTIRIEAPADLPTLNADIRLIRRVILNLLSNAIKHTPPGTQVTMRACAKPSVMGMEWTPSSPDIQKVIVFEIADTGPGIPAEYLDHIFQKFGRVNGERNGRQESTGLGLTFCRLAVEAHSGSIEVTSIVGQGTTFCVTLPLT